VVPHRDVVISLKTAPEPVKEKILQNMSESRQRLVKEEVESLPPMRASDVEAAQRRIIKRLEDLYPDTLNAPAAKSSLPRLA
jgi:flagellar motor switch protein FliG